MLLSLLRASDVPHSFDSGLYFLVHLLDCLSRFVDLVLIIPNFSNDLTLDMKGWERYLDTADVIES